MTEQDKPAFAAIMALLAESFDKGISKNRIGVYFDALQDFELETVKAASRQLVRDSKFFPKASELREYAEAAPKPKAKNAVGANAAQKQIPDLTPPEEAKKKLRGIVDKLNASFGTSFDIENDQRPRIVSGTEERN